MSDNTSLFAIDESNIEHVLYSIPLFFVQLLVYVFGLEVPPGSAAGIAWFWTCFFWFIHEMVQEADCRRHGLRSTTDTRLLQVVQFWKWPTSQNRDWIWPAVVATGLYVGVVIGVSYVR